MSKVLTALVAITVGKRVTKKRQRYAVRIIMMFYKSMRIKVHSLHTGARVYSLTGG